VKQDHQSDRRKNMSPFTLAVIATRLLAAYILVMNVVLSAFYYLLRFAMEMRKLPTSDWSFDTLSNMGILENLGFCGGYFIVSAVLYLNSVAIATRLSRGLDLVTSQSAQPKSIDSNP